MKKTARKRQKIERTLPPLGLTAECPLCHSRARDDQKGEWVVTVDFSEGEHGGLHFRKKRSRKERFFLPWRRVLNEAIVRGRVL